MTALRLVGLVVFIAIALGVLAATHYYLALRLIVEPALPPALERVLLGALAVLGASIVALPAADRLLPRRLLRVVAWPPSVWMGLMFLLFVGVTTSDLALWLAGSPALAGGTEGAGAVGPARVRAGAVVALALGAGAHGLVSALRGPVHERVEVEIERWPRAFDGFRIVQISDLHIGPILDRAFAERVVTGCNALEPDLIAVTGDLVDGSVEHLRPEVAPLARLQAREGVFFVTGNHDHYSGARGWVRVAAELGMRVLRNERVAIERDGASIDLAGVDDHQGTFEEGWREDLEKALGGRDPQRPLVLLAHDPRTFVRARRMGVDLQLSGHTHGGQIWPFRYFVRLITRWVAGLYREGDAQIYVSRGTGFWGPPMRLFTPAEITELVIRCPP